MALAETEATPVPSAQEELRVLRERVAFLERQWAEHVCTSSTSSGGGPRAGCAAASGSSSGGGASRTAAAEGGSSSGGGSRATATEGGSSSGGGSRATAAEGGGFCAAAAGTASAFTCTAAPACSFSTRSAQAFLQHFGSAHRSELLGKEGGAEPSGFAARSFAPAAAAPAFSSLPRPPYHPRSHPLTVRVHPGFCSLCNSNAGTFMGCGPCSYDECFKCHAERNSSSFLNGFSTGAAPVFAEEPLPPPASSSSHGFACFVKGCGFSSPSSAAFLSHKHARCA